MGRADGKVVRYHRPHSAVVATLRSPKGTGYEPHLYTLRGVPPECRALLEKECFHPVDSAASSAHKVLLGGGLNTLGGPGRTAWARFMMSMRVRGPFAMAELARCVEATIRETLGRDRAPEGEDALEGEDLYAWTLRNDPDFVADEHKRLLPGLIDHKNLGEHLINMSWGTLDCSAATKTLLTGDRPMLATNGWGDPECVILFPLSPTVLFVAANRRERLEDSAHTPRSELVRMANAETVRMAAEFVVGTDASHLTFVEKHLRRRDEEPISGPVGKGRPGRPQ